MTSLLLNMLCNKIIPVRAEEVGTDCSYTTVYTFNLSPVDRKLIARHYGKLYGEDKKCSKRV